jgi:type II secretory pathway component PulF
MGDTQADLVHFLDTSTATQIQNWLYVWKPFIIIILGVFILIITIIFLEE